MSRPLIMLDLNNTFFQEKETSPFRIDQIILDPEDLKAIVHAQQQGIALAVISNQPAIEEKGKFTVEELEKFVKDLLSEAEKYGLRSAEVPIYTCPHKREIYGTCREGCHKPGAGAVVRLFNDHGPYDYYRTAYIGDKPNIDIDLAVRCGFLGVQVTASGKYEPDPNADYVAKTLGEAIKWLEAKWLPTEPQNTQATEFPQ